MGEFGLGYTMWLSSQIREQSVSDDEQVSEPEVDKEGEELNKVIAIWDHLKFDEAKTLTEAQKLYDKFKRGLTNRGLTDTTGNWQALCKEKGWRAKK
jgi:hypothetical protein